MYNIQVKNHIIEEFLHSGEHVRNNIMINAMSLRDFIIRQGKTKPHLSKETQSFLITEKQSLYDFSSSKHLSTMLSDKLRFIFTDRFFEYWSTEDIQVYQNIVLARLIDARKYLELLDDLMEISEELQSVLFSSDVPTTLAESLFVKRITSMDRKTLGQIREKQVTHTLDLSTVAQVLEDNINYRCHRGTNRNPSALQAENLQEALVVLDKSIEEECHALVFAQTERMHKIKDSIECTNKQDYLEGVQKLMQLVHESIENIGVLSNRISQKHEILSENALLAGPYEIRYKNMNTMFDILSELEDKITAKFAEIDVLNDHSFRIREYFYEISNISKSILQQIIRVFQWSDQSENGVMEMIRERTGSLKTKEAKMQKLKLVVEKELLSLLESLGQFGFTFDESEKQSILLDSTTFIEFMEKIGPHILILRNKTSSPFPLKPRSTEIRTLFSHEDRISDSNSVIAAVVIQASESECSQSSMDHQHTNVQQELLETSIDEPNELGTPISAMNAYMSQSSGTAEHEATNVTVSDVDVSTQGIKRAPSPDINPSPKKSTLNTNDSVLHERKHLSFWQMGSSNNACSIMGKKDPQDGAIPFKK